MTQINLSMKQKQTHRLVVAKGRGLGRSRRRKDWEFGIAKECSNYCTIALISHASKVMLKILQARLQQNVNREPPNVQVGFKKGRGTRGQIANICWIVKKAREFQKNIYFCFIDYALLTVWITINCGKFFKRWEYQTT